MGYNTNFEGELRFTKELTATQLAAINAMLSEDCRDHPEWNNTNLYYIDLELTKDFGGLKWNGAEKTYDLEQIVNVVIEQMRKTWPDFGLTGVMSAQGEDMSDRWALVIGDDGFAHKQEVVLTGEIVKCPHCGEKFALEDTKK